jgi:predicted DNA-binding transcriptional regulator AlpA
MTAKPITLPETGFLRLKSVLTFYPISKSAWFAGVKAGRYPKPVKLSERTVAWRVEDIRALLASKGGNTK